MTIVVFGSINMDLVARTPHLPQTGQTLIGHSFATTPGGKGANQAVAAARLGMPTRMIGSVGDDGFGATLRDGLIGNGVDVAGVARASGSSGVALIAVDDAAENTIIVVPGANGLVGDEDVARLQHAVGDAKVLLLQLEVPLPAVLAAAQAARAAGLTVILDPAPAQPLPPELYQLVDVITPNESEAAALVGFALLSQADAARAAAVLCERGAGAAIIKMGSRGALLHHNGETTFAPAFPVQAVDTVAAGDAFNGALAAALGEGLPLHAALRWGLAGGACSVTKRGAQAATPTRAELLAMLDRTRGT